MTRPPCKDRKREGGTVMVLVAGTAITLMLLAALAIDVGFVWAGRTQGQGAVDGAAMAAAANLISGTGEFVTFEAARVAGKQVAQNNISVRDLQLQLNDADFRAGNWDPETGVFTQSGVLTDPDLVTAIRVELRQDGSDNPPPPLFLANALDLGGVPRDPEDQSAPTQAPTITVRNQAIAYLGFPGDFGERELELPIAIDAGELSSDSDGCGVDYCESIIPAPNACSLDNPQGGDTPGNVTCLAFNTSINHNACWTSLNGDSVDVLTLRNRIRGQGNPDPLQAGDSVDVAQVGFPAVLHSDFAEQELRDAFYGINDPFWVSVGPQAEDRYLGVAEDSWVVRLPVIENQDTDFCSGTARVLGAVCFEIREVTAFPDPFSIKGRFLCPTSPDPIIRARFQEYCSIFPTDDDAEALNAGPGGCNFGLRASRAVLVQ
ncbi:MAG: TadG family pilus assembly protein [Myxococcota bacterium]